MSLDTYVSPIIFTIVSSIIFYNFYRMYNTDIKQQSRLELKRDNEIIKRLIKQDEWEERCLQAGKILPR